MKQSKDPNFHIHSVTRNLQSADLGLRYEDMDNSTKVSYPSWRVPAHSIMWQCSETVNRGKGNSILMKKSWVEIEGGVGERMWMVLVARIGWSVLLHSLTTVEYHLGIIVLY